MAFCKKFLVVFLVLSTISLCLAKPRWIWLRDEENNDEDFNTEFLTREKKGENFMEDWKMNDAFKRCKNRPDCPL